MAKVARRVRSVIVLAISMMAIMALGAGTALAQEYPPGEAFSVSCVAAGEAGLSVSCTVTGAAPHEQLSVTMEHDGNVFHSEVLSANAEGEATFRATAPRDARGDEVVVAVEGPISGTAVDSVTIAEPGRSGEPVPPGRLAFTGQDALLAGVVGLALLGGGIFALRHRKATKQSTTTGV
jgi:hypothetical protein